MFLYSWLLYVPLLMLMTFIILQLFFNSLIFSSAIAVLAIGFNPIIKKIMYERLTKEREYEFMIFIRSLSSIMSVGRSFETAVVMAIQEVKKENNANVLLDDFNEMLILIEANTNYSELFDIFADKYTIESMVNFSKILKLVLRQGSSIHRVIENTVLMIEEKTEVEKELEVLIAQKKYELFILLTFVPLIIFYLSNVSSGFSLTMYGTIMGKIVMGVCLCIYIISAIVGKKIVDIEV